MSRWNRPNIGTIDRALRALLGVAAISLVVTGPRSAWGFVGVVLLFTAAVGFCPLYAMLGLTTRPRKVS
jgi:DUF2892 family protein